MSVAARKDVQLGAQRAAAVIVACLVQIGEGSIDRLSSQIVGDRFLRWYTFAWLVATRQINHYALVACQGRVGDSKSERGKFFSDDFAGLEQVRVLGDGAVAIIELGEAVQAIVHRDSQV